METVAGFHVSPLDGHATATNVRGITGRVLLLVNNTPIAQGLVNAYLSTDNVLLYDVERIEIVRGPGSALYGADALAGVINLATKTGQGIHETQVGALAGSFDTVDGYVLHGGLYGGFDVGIYLAARRTEATDAAIEADAQSGFDEMFATNASLAPGKINGERELFDTRIDVSRGPWQFRLSYFDQDNFHSGAGLALALDPSGTFDLTTTNVDLVYDRAYSDRTNVTASFAYTQVDQAMDLTLFPAGAFGDTFPEGVIQQGDAEENRLRGEVSILHTGWSDHIARFGFGAFTNDFHMSSDRRNHTPQGSLLIPTGPVTEIAGVDAAILVEDTDRNVHYLYAQDEWAFATDWRFTGGVRWDHYSDFGDTVNPRLGLVWAARHDINVKFLYGRAFRPPSVVELQSNGIFVGLGNPDLDPVILDMVEASIQYRQARFTGGATVYWYTIDDLNRLVPNPASPNGLQFANIGGQEGWGIELEATWRLIHDLTLKANYAYQNTNDTDSEPNANIRFTPRHQLYTGLVWRFAPEWNVSLNTISVIDRERATTDPRAAPDDYTLVDVSVGREALFNTMRIALSVRNLFDEDARAASNSAATTPGDIPLPGRAIYGQIEFAL